MTLSKANKTIIICSIFICLIVWGGLTMMLSLSTFLVLKLLILMLEIHLLYRYRQRDILSKPIFGLFLVWIGVTLVRSFSDINRKESMTFFIENATSLLAFTCVLMFNDLNYVKEYFRIYFKYGVPLFLLLSFFMLPGCWGWFLCPVYLCVILQGQLKRKWRILFLFLLLMSFYDIDTRANLMRAAAAFVCFLVLNLRHMVNLTLLCKIGSLTFLIVPIILLILGVSGRFNVFEIGADKEDNLYADTRTLVYQEVIMSSVRHDYVLNGRTFASGYDSVFQEQFQKKASTAVRTSEVSACNIFTWMGIIGLLLYFMVYVASIYHSVFKSNNDYIKVLGLFLAFRWLMAFVEDVNGFNTVNFSIIIVISLCLNRCIVYMNNNEFENTLKSITNNFK